MVEETQLVRKARVSATIIEYSKSHGSSIHGYVDGDLFTKEEWMVVEEISRGSFGRVTKEKKNSLFPYGFRALNRFEPHEHSKSLDYKRGLNTIFEFSQEKYQPYFVKAYKWPIPETTNLVCIAMEYFGQGSLKQLLGELSLQDISERELLPPYIARDITQQLLQGLSFMHRRGYAHRDLKPANILVESPPPFPWVKIADFGISTHVKDKAEDSTMRWTWGYQSPEADGFVVRLKKIDNRTDDRPRDIWALGEICFQLLTKTSTFSNLKQKVDYINGQSVLPSIDRIDRIASSAKNFVSRAMRVHPEDRIAAHDALEDEWIKPSMQENQKVFGVQLDVLMKYAATDGMLIEDARVKFEQDLCDCAHRLPILVAKCGELVIREVWRMNSHHNFHDQESQDHEFQLLDCVKKDDFKRLKNDFDRSSRFGRSPEWKDATIPHAVLLISTFVKPHAVLLISTFVKQLPDPIIPFKHRQSIGRDTAKVSYLQELSEHSVKILLFCLYLVDYLRQFSQSTYIRVPHELKPLISSVLLQSIDEEPRDKEMKSSRADVLQLLLDTFVSYELPEYKGIETDYPDNFMRNKSLRNPTLT